MFRDMIWALTGDVPGIGPKAKSLINEALDHIYNEQMWSWQLQTAGWLTSGLLFGSGFGNSAGTITATPFSNKVIGDAVATAAWAAYSGRPLLTECQLRNPSYSLYNIVGVDFDTNAPYCTLTLDRPWMEPAGNQIPYMIYQAYYAAPVSDFKRFLEARDTTNNAPVDYWSLTQRDLSFKDPQRTIFDEPGYIVPFTADSRPGSSTLGSMLYELWPHPLSVLPYSFMYLRRGPHLVAPSDMVPFPLTEEAVMWRAKECTYLWKEAQKGEEMQRGSGADWKFLSQAAHAEYEAKVKQTKAQDRDLVDLYMSRYRGETNSDPDGFATTNGRVNIGSL